MRGVLIVNQAVADSPARVGARWPILSADPQMTWFNILAGVASIVGAFLSWRAWKQATKASEAATETRKAIFASTTADELALACARAEQLLSYLTQRHPAEARLRADELIAGLSELVERRKLVLAADSYDRLCTVRAQVQDIAEALSNGTADPLAGASYGRIVKAARVTVVAHLREVLGKARTQVD
jgi:hypothetical protein